jgi:hypothetical protein
MDHHLIEPETEELEFAESARLSLLQAARDLRDHGQLTPPERELLGSVLAVFTREERSNAR